MSLERIWAGWRTTYVTRVSADVEPPGEADGCVLCRLADVDDPEGLVLARTERVFAVMNAYPYTSGHLMVAPVRHEATLEGLDADEAGEVMQLLQQAAIAVQAAYSPEGMNVGLNVGRAGGAGIPGHLHVHVLPRWGGDTNFMTSIADARVLPESLTTSWERLRAVWP